MESCKIGKYRRLARSVKVGAGKIGQKECDYRRIWKTSMSIFLGRGNNNTWVVGNPGAIFFLRLHQERELVITWSNSGLVNHTPYCRDPGYSPLLPNVQVSLGSVCEIKISGIQVLRAQNGRRLRIGSGR